MTSLMQNCVALRVCFRKYERTENVVASRQCSELTGHNEPTPAVYRIVTMSLPTDGDNSFPRNINIYLLNDTVLHGRGLVIPHLE